MRSSYSIILESDEENDFIKIIEFFGSYRQARKVFDSLMYALVQSNYTAVRLFCGEKELTHINYKR